MLGVDRVEINGSSKSSIKPLNTLAEYNRYRAFLAYQATLPDGESVVSAFFEDAQRAGVLPSYADPKLEKLVYYINNSDKFKLAKVTCGDLTFDPNNRVLEWNSGANTV